MKKSLFLICVLMCSVSAFAKSRSLPGVSEVLPYRELKTELLMEIMQGNHPNLAVEFSEGADIPIQFFQKMPLFQIDFLPDMKIRVHQTCFFRVVRRSAYVSFDGENWKRASRFLAGDHSTKVKFDGEQPRLAVESEFTPYEQPN